MTVVTQTQDAGITAADDPLLSYSVSTTPSPLKASPENPQAPEEIGEVIISVARQSGTPADVEWIRVKVPAGTMAPDLATDLNKISPRISLTGWTVRLDETAKEFVCAPVGSHAPIGPDTGFTIQLSDIPISRKVGTAPITVTERSRTGSSAFQNRPTVFNLGKFPADFYLRNFLCEPSIINNGGDVALTWERSPNATYELLYGDVNRDVTHRTSLDIEGITSDTTFYLRATTGDPTNPVIRIISAQVTVLKPDLELGSLTVHGTSAFNDALTVQGPTTLNGVLAVTQDTDAFRKWELASLGSDTVGELQQSWTAPTSGWVTVTIRKSAASNSKAVLWSGEAGFNAHAHCPPGTEGASAMLPVGAGQDFGYSLSRGDDGNRIKVDWVAFGVSTRKPVYLGATDNEQA
ncbi:hypothetical protein [Streptomyces sp. SP18CS02]|uniref:hypothetical protein n=1 Tax=Streptomyces sp. SP18CS02 TaxID=3002531 RepID=UPI002E768B78|nr:hypothetical protein [Streptomyces sp. SP18CS02]MEE1754434.1 hypothetical protein [Streptomyces sp. SP18CS02]